mgnify:CR=1 FL=1
MSHFAFFDTVDYPCATGAFIFDKFASALTLACLAFRRSAFLSFEGTQIASCEASESVRCLSITLIASHERAYEG